MFTILDRYVVREVVLPFLLWVLVLTFVLEIPPILQQGERLIAKGVEWSVVVRVLLTLLPQALSITIPMSLLVGLLVGLGRLSADREFVALQSCGVSIFRLLRPVALLAVAAGLATAYVLIVSLPNANQTFREITYRIVATQAASDVKPRVFFDNFPDHVLYVRETPPGGGWKDVFLADSSRPDQTTVFFAKSGQLLLNAEKRTVQLLLDEGTRHTIMRNRPEDYEATVFDRVVISLDPDTVFPRVSLVKGEPEMTIAELRASVVEAASHGDPGYNQRLMIQQKFSFPVACGVLALLALGLGVTNRKDGKLASFVLGLAIIFAYYVLLWTARSAAKGGAIPAELAPWVPNIVLGVIGIGLLAWRAGAADHPIRISIPGWLTALPSRWLSREATPGTATARAATPGTEPGSARQPVVIVLRIPHLDLPAPRLLDRYVARQYLTVFGLAFLGMLGLFYISTFMDVMEKLVRGAATGAQLLRYFYYLTPQYVYFVIPISALLSTLVTIGLLTKNSELIVMRACGVSLYRSALPLFFFALIASGALYGLQENVLADSNRQAEALRHVMNGYPPQTFGILDRRWLVAGNGDLYHYEFFDPRSNRFTELSIFHLGERVWQLDTLIHAQQVALTRTLGGGTQWTGANGWVREFATGKRRNMQKYVPFTTRDVPLDGPDYFKTDEPEPDRMTYNQLRRHIEQLQASGFHVVPYMVALQRKIAFPFVTVIMTLLAVPFAVTTGRRGSLYGVGVGIVLAIVYWTAQSVFAAVGSGGLISPMLAAWAPNILFGAAALYLILTVRT